MSEDWDELLSIASESDKAKTVTLSELLDHIRIAIDVNSEALTGIESTLKTLVEIIQEKHSEDQGRD